MQNSDGGKLWVNPDKVIAVVQDDTDPSLVDVWCEGLDGCFQIRSNVEQVKQELGYGES